MPYQGPGSSYSQGVQPNPQDANLDFADKFGAAPPSQAAPTEQDINAAILQMHGLLGYLDQINPPGGLPTQDSYVQQNAPDTLTPEDLTLAPGGGAAGTGLGAPVAPDFDQTFGSLPGQPYFPGYFDNTFGEANAQPQGTPDDLTGIYAPPASVGERINAMSGEPAAIDAINQAIGPQHFTGEVPSYMQFDGGPVTGGLQAAAAETPFFDATNFVSPPNDYNTFQQGASQWQGSIPGNDPNVANSVYATAGNLGADPAAVAQLIYRESSYDPLAHTGDNYGAGQYSEG